MPSLKESFDSFILEISRLEASYHTLQEEFKELHRQLDSSAATLSAIAAHLSEGLMFVSMEGSIELFNASASRLTGYLLKEVLYTSYWKHFPDDFFGFSLEKALKEKFHARKTVLNFQGIEDPYQDSYLTSGYYEVEVSSSFIPEKGVLLLMRDLTEQRHLEKTLARNDRLRELGEVAAALAHEIRNPLGGIQGFASLLSRDLDNCPEQKFMATAILEGTRSLNRLVSNVLNYARPLEMHFLPCEACTLIQETLAFLNVDEKCTSVCTFTPQANPCFIYVDKELFKMALLNLLQNAIQASPSPQSVRVSLDQKEGFVSIAITDKGGGISKGDQEKIFLPFFTTKSTGTGLGLSETQKIVHAHEGTIEVYSQIGVGSTFILKVPCYAADRKNPHC